MNVQARNYVGGLLVDMSIAMTEPHYLFAIHPEWRVNDFRLADMYSYDIMMKDENIPTWDRAIRNENYCTTKLRSRNTNGAIGQASHQMPTSATSGPNIRPQSTGDQGDK